MNIPSSRAPSSTVHPAPETSDSMIAGVLYGLLAATAWGMSPVITRVGVTGSLDPFDLAALRFIIAGLILLPLVMRKRLAGLGLGVISVMVVGAGAPFILLFSGGLIFAPAGHGGIIVPSTMLCCSMLGGWIVQGDRPDNKRLFGYGLILLGIAMVGWEGVTGSFGPDTWIGDLMFLCAGIVWAIYTVASKASKADPLHATALVAVISMVIYLPPYFVWGTGDLMAAPLQEILVQAVFQGIVMAILALLFYTRAVAIMGASRGAVFAALVPGIAVLLAFPVLGEAPNWLELAGVLVVSFGMIHAMGVLRNRN